MGQLPRGRSVPPAGASRDVYLIGQLGNWIPIPGGIGGVELGLVGTALLYGLPAVTATAATAAILLYRIIELWMPALLGLAAFVQLRVLLQQEKEAINLCQPGDTIEIVGRGATVV